jgi:hypothetical protein
MEKKYSRRNLFKKVFFRREETRDALFERYKRRNYGLRRYEPIDASAEANRIGNITSGLAPYSGA